MPSPSRSLTPAHVHDFVRRECFEPPDTAQGGLARVGVELELLTLTSGDPLVRPAASTLAHAVASLAPTAHATLTLEPGGQVELSSRPHAGAAAAIAATAADLGVVRSGLASAGIETIAVGLDPDRPHGRVVRAPRYDAMEAYFDGRGAAGRAMMCGTASVQVNVDLGDAEMVGRRWRVAHAIGPMLVAAFANSPLADGRPTGARSSRQQIWAALDRTRTAPVLSWDSPKGLAPADTWARYALAADVMLIRGAPDRFHPVAQKLPFATWMADGHELGYPTVDDLAYHLTTLFPPVRPKGWLELRMIDAVPDPWWAVAVAVAYALLEDPEALDIADRACRPVAHCWSDAAAHGLAHPGLASAARTCFAAALEAMPRLALDPGTIGATVAFIETYVDRARCPGDDLLYARRATIAPRKVGAGRS